MRLLLSAVVMLAMVIALFYLLFQYTAVTNQIRSMINNHFGLELLFTIGTLCLLGGFAVYISNDFQLDAVSQIVMFIGFAIVLSFLLVAIFKLRNKS